VVSTRGDTAPPSDHDPNKHVVDLSLAPQLER